MAGRPGKSELSSGGQGLDQMVKSLMRRHAPDEEHTRADDFCLRAKALRVGAAVDDAGPGWRRTELVGRVLRDREEALEEAGQQPAPITSLQTVIRDDHVLSRHLA